MTRLARCVSLLALRGTFICTQMARSSSARSIHSKCTNSTQRVDAFSSVLLQTEVETGIDSMGQQRGRRDLIACSPAPSSPECRCLMVSFYISKGTVIC